MTVGRAPRTLQLLGALLVVYIGYPVGAFVYRVATGSNEGWNAPGLLAALRVSVEGATISLAIGVLAGIPLAYVLARRSGWLSSVVGAIVQLPLAIPPLMSGILLIYIVGPYTFLGRLSGERLTETTYGVIIAQSFVSVPFLIVVARSAFRAVDPSLADVAATLGHGPFARFMRVEAPAASDGLRAGMILLWLRAFGEYGTVVVLAYHPYSLPVYVENVFSSAPLSQAEAPTVVAFGVAALAIAAGHFRWGWLGVRGSRVPPPRAPVPGSATAVGFDIDAKVGTFTVRVSHPESSHRLAIVGPSGAGKSVTLRTLAGLLGTDAGTVTCNGVDIGAMASEHRRIGYVPQGFGLLPGRTVWRQVLFGVDADPALAAWWLQTLRLDGLLDRVPEQLSGGQRQRVSLARALAVDPTLVLLDEPFSSLDAPVRAELRRELRRLQREVNLSTVIVTHDPEEAAMLADEIIVISDGRVLQAGRCRDVYRRPASVEVGRLLGIDNLFEGTAPPSPALSPLEEVEPRRASAAPGEHGPAAPATPLTRGTSVLWHVAPEDVLVRPHTPGSGTGGSGVRLGTGRVTDIIDLGRTTEVVLELADGRELRARASDVGDLTLGLRYQLETTREAVSVWPAAAGQ